MVFVILFLGVQIPQTEAIGLNCDLLVPVTGDQVRIYWGARHEPPAEVYISVRLYVDGEFITEISSNTGSANTQTFLNYGPGSHLAEIYSEAYSGGTSCYLSKPFTIDNITACSNGADDDGDGLSDYPDDPGCDSPGDNDEYNEPLPPPPPPAPGPFNVTSGACYDWPNPKVETNFSPSSGAISYTLQKWNGSSYVDIYSGSYQEIDSYGDPNVSSGNTYFYRVVAHNSSGSTISNGEWEQYVNQPNCGGPSSYSLSVTVSGSGTVSGTGISCPGDCSENVTYDTWITITATPSPGNTFSSWSGACAGQGSSCSLYMNQARSTTANFSANSYALSVAKAGTGSGTITSSPAGISCGSDCSESYTLNTQVTLTRNADQGSNFGGWSGACSGQGANCTVTMDAAKSVTATFNGDSYALTVSKSGAGSGTVTSSPSGISCGSDCSENYSNNTSVILTASASSGSDFGGWSGHCSGTGTCNLTMNAAKNVTAAFNTAFNYSLSNSGNSNVTKESGNAFTQNTITKTLTAGATQAVTLTLSGVPSGTSYSISNSSCSPTCTSVITFTVSPSTAAGTYPITVTGSPLSRQTSFNLVVTGAPFSVSCAGSPATVLLGQTVTWTATVSGGTSPYTYSWSGTAIPTSPAPSTNPYSRSYSTIGQKSAQATVTDSESVQSTCPAATVQVNFDPNFEEF